MVYIRFKSDQVVGRLMLPCVRDIIPNTQFITEGAISVYHVDEYTIISVPDMGVVSTHIWDVHDFDRKVLKTSFWTCDNDARSWLGIPQPLSSKERFEDHWDCNHEWVDYGFMHSKWCCKHCGEEKK